MSGVRNKPSPRHPEAVTVCSCGAPATERCYAIGKGRDICGKPVCRRCVKVVKGLRICPECRIMGEPDDKA